MSNKEYTCICGKTFVTPASFNGHKQGCKIHITNKYGSIEAYYANKNRNSKAISESLKKRHAEKRQEKQDAWVQEQHTCKRCGVIMTEKYASGTYCSKSCANARSHSQQTRDKLSKTMKQIPLKGAVLTSKLHHTNNHGACNLPKYCVVCNKLLDKEMRYRKTCSDECKRIRLRQQALDRGFGGPSTVSSFGKRGTYKGIHCDSTYELALLIYCLDHNISIIRNVEKFPYMYEGKQYNYYPDFYLPEYDLFIETKGRDIGPVYEKAQGVLAAGRKIRILHYEDLVPCFNYIKETYNVSTSVSTGSLYKLYDDYDASIT